MQNFPPAGLRAIYGKVRSLELMFWGGSGTDSTTGGLWPGSWHCWVFGNDCSVCNAVGVLQRVYYHRVVRAHVAYQGKARYGSRGRGLGTDEGMRARGAFITPYCTCGGLRSLHLKTASSLQGGTFTGTQPTCPHIRNLGDQAPPITPFFPQNSPLSKPTLVGSSPSPGQVLVVRISWMSWGCQHIPASQPAQ